MSIGYPRKYSLNHIHFPLNHIPIFLRGKPAYPRARTGEFATHMLASKTVLVINMFISLGEFELVPLSRCLSQTILAREFMWKLLLCQTCLIRLLQYSADGVTRKFQRPGLEVVVHSLGILSTTSELKTSPELRTVEEPPRVVGWTLKTVAQGGPDKV